MEYKHELTSYLNMLQDCKNKYVSDYCIELRNKWPYFRMLSVREYNLIRSYNYTKLARFKILIYFPLIDEFYTTLYNFHNSSNKREVLGFLQDVFSYQ